MAADGEARLFVWEVRSQRDRLLRGDTVSTWSQSRFIGRKQTLVDKPLNSDQIVSGSRTFKQICRTPPHVDGGAMLGSTSDSSVGHWSLLVTADIVDSHLTRELYYGSPTWGCSRFKKNICIHPDGSVLICDQQPHQGINGGASRWGNMIINKS